MSLNPNTIKLKGWGGGGGGPRSYKTVKKTKDCCEKGPCLNLLVVIMIIFVVLMKNRIFSAYVPRTKVLIFADLVYYLIFIM